MTRQRVQYVLVCEDQQQEAFARRFLRQTNIIKDLHQLRVENAVREAEERPTGLSKTCT